MGNWVYCRMPQSDTERERGITFRWEEMMEAVLRDTNLYYKIILLDVESTSNNIVE